jgi:hypothetical protein
MGARLVKFEFIPKENEQIETIVKVPEERRSVIHGIVKDWRNKIVKDAVVKLFEVSSTSNSYMLNPINHTFTDEHGQFLFGPLCPNKKYLIKVWFNDAKIRELLITPEAPDDCDDEQDESEYKCDEEQDHEKENDHTGSQRPLYREREKNYDREKSRRRDRDYDEDREEED